MKKRVKRDENEKSRRIYISCALVLILILALSVSLYFLNNSSNKSVVGTGYATLDANSDWMVSYLTFETSTIFPDSPDNFIYWADISDNDNNGHYFYNNDNDAGVFGQGFIGQSSLIFDGMNDFILLPTLGGFKPQEASITAWIKYNPADNFGNHKIIYAKSDKYDSFVDGLEITVYGSNINCRFGNASSQRLSIYTQLDNANTWNHIACVSDGNNVKLYVNSEEKASQQISGLFYLEADNNPYVGKAFGVSNRYFKGYLDEFRLYNKALTAEEISKVYVQRCEKFVDVCGGKISSPGSYCLLENIECSNPSAVIPAIINITSSNVVLDGNNKQVIGTGDNYAVYASNVKNVTVKNFVFNNSIIEFSRVNNSEISNNYFIGDALASNKEIITVLGYASPPNIPDIHDILIQNNIIEKIHRQNANGFAVYSVNGVTLLNNQFLFNKLNSEITFSNCNNVSIIRTVVKSDYDKYILSTSKHSVINLLYPYGLSLEFSDNDLCEANRQPLHFYLSATPMDCEQTKIFGTGNSFNSSKIQQLCGWPINSDYTDCGYVAPSPPPGGDGNGGNGGTSSSYWTRTYTVTSAELSAGYKKAIGVKNRFRFIIAGEEHYVGVISLSGNTAKIEVASTPQQVVISAGETKKFDTNADGYYDLSVMLNSISSNNADITIKLVYEQISAESVCGDGDCDFAIGEDCTNCPADCGECGVLSYCGNEECEVELGEDCTNCPADCGECGEIAVIWVALGIVVIVIVLIVMVYFLTRKQ